MTVVSVRERPFGVKSIVWVMLCMAVLAAGCSGAETTAPRSVEAPGGDGTVVIDDGVDADAHVIRVGINVVLSGPFRFQAAKIVEAQLVYWEWLNNNGGDSGWTVEPVVLDDAYDPEHHVENYRAMTALYDITADAGWNGVFEVGYDVGHFDAGPQLYYAPCVTDSDPEAANGYSLLAGSYTSDIARDWTCSLCHQLQ